MLQPQHLYNVCRFETASLMLSQKASEVKKERKIEQRVVVETKRKMKEPFSKEPFKYFSCCCLFERSKQEQTEF